MRFSVFRKPVMKKKGDLTLGCFVFLLCCHIIYGQKTLTPEVNPPDARFDNFLVMNGRAFNTFSVFQDSKGFIWSGSLTGLYRFDGKNYIEYKNTGSKNDSTGFLGYRVNAIFEDSEGMMWIGTESALNRLDRRSGKFTHFVPDASGTSPVHNSVRLIREDSNGFLWVITNGDYYSFNRSTGVYTRYPTDLLSWHSMMDNEYYVGSQHYLEDINGRIWLATDDGLRVHFENQLYKKVWPIRGSPWSKELYKVNCVICDHTGTIWCGTENDGLIRIIDPLKDLIEKVSPGINEEALPGNCIKAMYADNSHNLWIFGKGAFIKYNTVTGNSTSYRIWTRSVKRFDLVKTEINDVFMDEGGNLWFICLGPGAVFRFNPLTEKLFLYLSAIYNFSIL